MQATLALGLRSTAQSLGVIGRALGIFERHGVDLRIVREETAGPEGLRGLVAGEYDFAEFGAVPVVQAALAGHAPLIVLAAEPISALYILARRGVARPATIGVLSAAGQTGFSAQQMLERWQHTATLVPRGTYPRIYAALAAREIDAGVLTADYRIAGEVAHGFTSLVDLGETFRFQGPVLATMRRLREQDPARIAAVAAGYVETIACFKSAPERVVPLLRSHLGFVDDAQASAIHSFYAARFQSRPFASVAGVARVIACFPGATLRAESLCDASFVQSALDAWTSA